MMKLYHGTNADFTKIELAKCKPNKDFGRGFYMTDIKKQAQEMAVRRCDIAKTGIPIVQEYKFDESLLFTDELNVKRFETVSKEWAEFVLSNRMSHGKMMHNYDVVVGPIADDGVVFQLNLYQQHLITIEQLVQGLTYKKLNSQYFFGTEKAISKLKRL